jgi:anti-anti-sigma regulatory factor
MLVTAARQPAEEHRGPCAVVRFRTLGLPVPDDPGADHHLRRLVDTVGQRQLYVDFSQVQRLTSGQIGGLVGLHKRLRARGSFLILGWVNPFVYEVFDRMQLTRLLDIRPEGQSPGRASSTCN